MTDLALLVLRVWLGLVMLAHGIHHARSQEGTAKWFASKGFRHAELNARGSALGELAVGTGLVLGLLTSVAATGLVSTMAVAFWSIHRFAGFFVFKRPDEGWEYVATLSVAATVVAVVGPGRFSLDEALGWADDLDGLTGLTLIGAGLVAAAIQLAIAWREPT
jgi:putative oxidoreductase